MMFRKDSDVMCLQCSRQVSSEASWLMRSCCNFNSSQRSGRWKALSFEMPKAVRVLALRDERCCRGWRGDLRPSRCGVLLMNLSRQCPPGHVTSLDIGLAESTCRRLFSVGMIHVPSLSCERLRRRDEGDSGSHLRLLRV